MREAEEPCSLPGWKAVRTIGGGTYGTVYEIQKISDLAGGSRSALKVISIPPSKDEYAYYEDSGYDEDSIVSMFQSQLTKADSEFKILERLKGHSHIVSYEDHEVLPHADGRGWDICIRMELLTSLSDYLRKTDLTVALILQIGIDICEALELCQKHHIVHRDIKPKNIFVNQDGFFKLGDFGIAEVVSTARVGTARIGTYTYMAPEVYHGGRYDARTDIYSLGLLLYWLLNQKKTPFIPQNSLAPLPEEEQHALTQRMRGEVLPSPLNGSKALQMLVLRACSFDVNDRFQDAQSMRQELERQKQTCGSEPPSFSPLPVPASAKALKVHDLTDSLPIHPQTNAALLEKPPVSDPKPSIWNQEQDGPSTVGLLGMTPEQDALRQKEKQEQRYRVRFLDEDGIRILSEDLYFYREELRLPPPPAQREEQNSLLLFDTWEPEAPALVDGSADYQARFLRTNKEYSVNFFDHKASLLESRLCPQGVVAQPPPPPLRKESETEQFFFSHWTPDITLPIVKNMDFVAVYRKVRKEKQAPIPPLHASKKAPLIGGIVGGFVLLTCLCAFLFWPRAEEEHLMEQGERQHIDSDWVAALAQADKEGTTEISYAAHGLRELSPIEQYPELTELDLSNNSIQDLAPLSSLTKLVSLNLSGNPVTDLRPLQNLSQLSYLYLTLSSVQDLSGIESLSMLSTLSLDLCSLTDISPLLELNKLRALNLRNLNQDTSTTVEFSSLAALSNLDYLDITNSNNASPTREKVFLLRQALPDCKIVSSYAFAESISFEHAELTVQVGENCGLAATVLPAEAAPVGTMLQPSATGGTLLWQSSNSAVAMVDQVGYITTVGAGSAEISASMDAVRTVATVTVTASQSAPLVQTNPQSTPAKPSSGPSNKPASSSGGTTQQKPTQQKSTQQKPAQPEQPTSPDPPPQPTPPTPQPPKPPEYKENNTGLDSNP